MLADTAPPRHSSSELVSALGLIAAVVVFYCGYGAAWYSAVLYVGQARNGISQIEIAFGYPKFA